MTSSEEALRALPAVDSLLRRVGRTPGAAQAARRVLQRLREEILAGRLSTLPSEAEMATAVAAELAASPAAYARVVNATGVLLHTGLGRAPLAAAAVTALREGADGFVRLEVDASTGQRRHREQALLPDLLALTGAAAGTVVNNNAGALLLALRALAAGREVLVSRGQLIEIGGGFRLPDVMALSGARLVEVGTTNRTYVEDFERALSPETALLLSVHTSNYRVVGFQHSPARAELVALARKTGVPLLEDIGSGLLAAAPGGALAEEPDAAGALKEGVDLVCFSGDKLLGGPQAGILVGREDLVARCRAEPLFRALRPDRLCLSALAATLRVHRDDPMSIPVLAALAASPRDRLEKARVLADELSRRFAAASFRALVSEAQVGSGSSPARTLNSAAVEVDWPGRSAEELLAALRQAAVPVFGRIWRGHLQLDVLALLADDAPAIVEAFEQFS